MRTRARCGAVQKWAAKLVSSTWFNLLFAVIIITNSLHLLAFSFMCLWSADIFCKTSRVFGAESVQIHEDFGGIAILWVIKLDILCWGASPSFAGRTWDSKPRLLSKVSGSSSWDQCDVWRDLHSSCSSGCSRHLHGTLLCGDFSSLCCSWTCCLCLLLWVGMALAWHGGCSLTGVIQFAYPQCWHVDTRGTESKNQSYLFTVFWSSSSSSSSLFPSPDSLA